MYFSSKKTYKKVWIVRGNYYIILIFPRSIPSSFSLLIEIEKKKSHLFQGDSKAEYIKYKCYYPRGLMAVSWATTLFFQGLPLVAPKRYFKLESVVS